MTLTTLVVAIHPDFPRRFSYFRPDTASKCSIPCMSGKIQMYGNFNFWYFCFQTALLKECSAWGFIQNITIYLCKLAPFFTCCDSNSHLHQLSQKAHPIAQLAYTYSLCLYTEQFAECFAGLTTAPPPCTSYSILYTSHPFSSGALLSTNLNHAYIHITPAHIAEALPWTGQSCCASFPAGQMLLLNGRAKVARRPEVLDWSSTIK